MKLKTNRGWRRIHKGCIAGLLIGVSGVGVTIANPTTTNHLEIDQFYGRVPLHFEVNRGQADSRAKFLARGHGYAIYLSAGQVDFALSPVQTNASKHIKENQETAQHIHSLALLRMKLAGANVKSQIVGEKDAITKVNYFIGNDPRDWHTNITVFNQVRYRSVYPGVDLVLYGNQQKLEYDFVVSPGADARKIRFEVQGTHHLEVNGDGDLVLQTAGGELKQLKPVAYQDVNGVRKLIDARYRLTGKSIGFQIGRYDHSESLVIDPVLVYSTFMGGSTKDDLPYHLAVDAAGAAYIAGYSADTLPKITTGAYDTNFAGSITVENGGDAYVAKLNPNGTAYEYLTYLGGSEADDAVGITFDNAGNAYITGQTMSANFPTTPGVLQTNKSDSLGFVGDAFVTKLNSNGTALVYSTYLGGKGSDLGHRIVLDSLKNAYVVGRTSSTNFPTTNAIQPNLGGGSQYDAFISKLNTNGSALIFSTFFGGSSNEYCLGLTLDATNAIYVTGWTSSTNFPTTNAFQATYGGGSFDGFVTKISPGGTNLEFSTFLGGKQDDGFNGIVVDASGGIFLGGETSSTNFPTTNALQKVLNGNGLFSTSYDGALTKIRPSGNALEFSTYFGGTNTDGIEGLGLDRNGNIWVIGYAGSIDFAPYANFGSINRGSLDACVAKLNTQGTILMNFTYLGGTNQDVGWHMGLDPQDNVILIGKTLSPDFPVSSTNVVQAAIGGGYDGFIAKLYFAKDELGTEVGLTWQGTGSPLTQTNGTLAVSNSWGTVGALPVPVANTSTATTTTRFLRGAIGDFTYNSFVIPLDFEPGVKLNEMGENTNKSTGDRPWFTRLIKDTRYHLNRVNSLSGTNGWQTNYYNYQTNFQNSIAAFGSAAEVAPLYLNQGYRFGVYAGAQYESTNADGAVFQSPVRLLVYRLSDFTPGQTNIVTPIATNLIAIPRRTVASDQAEWDRFATNGFTVTIETNGLRTTLQLVEERTGAWGVTPQFANTRNGPYLLTHRATTADYGYVIESLGVVPIGTNLYPMVTNSSGNFDWCKLYCLNFDMRPPWRSVFIDQPHFNGKPLPSAYQGKSGEDATNSRLTSVITLTGNSYTNLDKSPELRRHPTLDKFVSDMAGDPIGLANFVINEVELTDALAYNETTGQASAPSVNQGGINRGALGTFLEGQGSPIEQCALLIYLLRQAGYPAAYMFPTNSNVQLLDTRLSKLLRMQVKGAVNDKGELYTTNSFITVNYPWVVANISNTCVHIFPWLKDTSINEGYNLYDFLSTNYNSGDKWFRRYISGDTNILALSSDTDAPSVLFLKFLKQNLLTNAPGISVDDVGTRAFNRRNYYSRWQDFPTPNVVTNETQVVCLDSLTSSTATNVSMAMTNIFNTVSVEVVSLSNTNNRLTTGPMRMADLHNRRFLITAPNSTNMMVWLSPYQPTTTNQSAFDASDTALTNKQILTITLTTNEVNFTLKMSHQRHRAVNFAPSPESYLGVSETLDFTVADRPFTRADVAAICLNAGRVTPAMLDVHSRAYAEMDQQRQLNTNNVPAIEDYQGAAAYLMGMDYYGKVSRFAGISEQLHKNRVVSWFAEGLSKLTPIKLGAQTLVRPSLDMFFNEVAYGASCSLRPDSGNNFLTGSDDFARILTAEIASQEHNLINGFYRSTNTVSAVTLLRLAQQRSSASALGIVELTKNNYLARGDTNSVGYGPNKLKDNDPEIWAAVTNAFRNWDADYVRAFITPGPVAVPAAQFRGMGLIIVGKSQSASLISFNMNGALGEQSSFFADTQASLSSSFSTSSSFDSWYSGSFDSSASYSPYIYGGNIYGGSPSSFYWSYSPWASSSYPYRFVVPVKNYPVVQYSATFTTPSQVDLARQVNELYNFPGSTSPAESLTRSLDRGNVGLPTWKKAFNYVADPVHVMSGEFYHAATDLVLPGPMPLYLQRNYSSHDQGDRNNFGYGWKINFVPYLSVATNTNSVVTISAAELDGSVIAYRQQTNDLNLFIPMIQDNPHLDNDSNDGIGSIHNRFNARIRYLVDGTNKLYSLSNPDGSVRVFQVSDFPVVGLTNTVTRQRPYLKTWADSRDNTCFFFYGSDTNAPEYGQLVRIESSNGNFIGLNYNAGGYVTQAFTGDGRRVRYEYNDFGDLTRVVLPDTSEEVYEYQYKQFTNSNVIYVDSTHLLTKEIKPGGRILENVYDSLRRVTVQKATVGSDLKTYTNAIFTYANNFTLSKMTNGITGFTLIKDVNNNTNRYDYSNSLVTRIAFPLSLSITQQWFYTNGSGGAYQRSLQSRTDTRGFKTSYLYNTNGNATNITFTGTLTGFASTNETASIFYSYNSNNLLQTVTDPSGNQRLYFYDTNFVFLPSVVVNATSNSWLSSNRFEYHSVTNGSFFARGLPQRLTRAINSPDAAIIEFDHDTRGFPTRIIQYSGTSDPNVTNFVVFNRRGELIEQSRGAARTNQFGYNARGYRTTREVWDNGSLVARSLSYYNANGELEWSDGPRTGPEDYVRFNYDGDGRLTTEIRWRSQAKQDGTGVEPPQGYDLYTQIFHEYDKFGNQTRTIDPRGAVTTNLWDALGQLTQRKSYDLDGTNILSTEGFAYEPGGSVTRYTNALGGIAETLYTGSGKPRHYRDADGSTNGWRYYLDGRLRREYQGNGAYWETTYDDANRKATRVFYSVSNAALATNFTIFDRRGNVVQDVDVGGNTFTNSFDGLDRLKIATGPASMLVTGTGPGPFDNPVTNILQQAVTNFYDSAGAVTTNINALGDKAITWFDALGRPTRSEIRNVNGNLVREQSAAYTSDHHGVTITNGSGAAAVASTTYTDNEGRPLLSITYPNANLREFVLNQYDLAGNLIYQERDSSTNGAITAWSGAAYTYDGLNRVVTQFDRDDALTTFAYNAMGSLTNQVMPGGLKWQATYNTAGQILKDWNTGSGAVNTRTNTYAYYASNNVFAGLLQTRTDGRGVTCTYTYDDWLRPATNTHTGLLAEQNLKTTFLYEVRGYPTNIIEQFTNSATGPITTVQRKFDSYGQLNSEIVSIDGNALYFAGQSWNVAGRRTVLDFGPHSYGFGWKADGQLAFASMSQMGSASYVYDTAGLLTTRTVGSRVTSTSSRDGMGRPLSVNTTINGISKLAETLTWTGDGLLDTHTQVREDFTDSRSYFYAYLSRRLSDERLNLDATKRWTNIYTFDNGIASGPGVLTKIGQSSASSQWSGVTDAFSRVNRETNSAARQLAYGRVNGPATITATLDGVPQPVMVIGTGSTLWTNQWRTTMEMTPGVHQLSVTAAHPSGQFTTNQTTWFTNNIGSLTVTNVIDAAGNLVQRIWRKPNGTTNLIQTLAWDGRGRLYKVTERDSNNSGRNFTVTYDAFGRRLQTTEIAVTNSVPLTNQPVVVSHYFDPLVEFLELAVTENNKTTWKLMGPDVDGTYGGQNGTGGFEAEAAGLLFSPVVSDAIGNVLALQDQGQLVWNGSRLGGFGGVQGCRPLTLGSGGSLAAKSAWRNRASDSVGLMWLGANWYDPADGQFISPDPLGHVASPSLYSYANQDPVNYFDADGRFGKKAWNTLRDFYGGDAEKHELALNNISQGFQVNIPRAIDETITAPASLIDWFAQQTIPPDQRPTSGPGSGDVNLFVERHVERMTVRAIRNGADPNSDAYQITLPASRGIVMGGTIIIPGVAEAKLGQMGEGVALRATLTEARAAQNGTLAITRGARVRIRIRASDFTPEERALIQARYQVANARIGVGAETANVGNQVPYEYRLSQRFVRDTMFPGSPVSSVRIPQGFNVDEFVSRQFGGRQVRPNQSLLPERINKALGPLEENAIRNLPSGSVIQGFDAEFY